MAIIINAGDALPADAGTAPSTPGGAASAAPSGEWGGYKSREELLQAHTALRTKMSQEGAPKSEPVVAPVTTAPPADAAAAAAKAGLDLSSLQSEYLANGNKLPETRYAALEAAGISRATVDQFVAGQEAIASQSSAEFAAHVGGPEKLTQIRDWAVASLAPAEQDAFNKVLDTGNKGAIKLALDGLKAKYEAANGTSAVRLNGEGDQPGSDTGYKSWAEMEAAMRDPRYDSDPAYREKIEQKVAVSDLGKFR